MATSKTRLSLREIQREAKVPEAKYASMSLLITKLWEKEDLLRIKGPGASYLYYLTEKGKKELILGRLETLPTSLSRDLSIPESLLGQKRGRISSQRGVSRKRKKANSSRENLIKIFKEKKKRVFVTQRSGNRS